MFTEFPLKDSFELLEGIWCFFRNARADSKNYVGLQDDEITEPVHTIKSTRAWHLENLRLHRQLEIFNELQQKASFEPNEKMRCLLGIAKRFLKLLWICSGRIRQACAYHKITAHWFLSDCRSRSQIDSVTVHWDRGRNAGLLSRTAAVNRAYLSTKTRLTLTPSNQYIFSAESYNQYILCVRITTYPRAVRDMETSPNHLLNCFRVLFSRKTLLLNIT